MRKVILESAISMDGFIEGPNGELDWLICDEEICNAAEFLARFDTVFYGRKAYEKLGIRPLEDGSLSEGAMQFLEDVNGMRKYVFSRVKKHVAGNGMVIFENLEQEVRRISEEEGKNIWFFGGADILKTFAELDLIDEYVLSVHPVLLRSGKALFSDTRNQLNLRLMEKRKLRSGVIKLYYRPESRIKQFAHDGRSF